MNLVFALANSNAALRRFEVGAYVRGNDRVVTVDVVGTMPVVQLYCEVAGVLQVSQDGGTTWDDVPADPFNGVEIGPVSGRKTLKLKLNVPALTAMRWKSIGLHFAKGV